MKRRFPIRVTGHTRSHALGYLALVLVLSASPAAAGRLVVRTADLAKGAVTTPKLKDGAVRTTKINSAAVTSDKIQNGAVTSDKIAGLEVPRRVGAAGQPQFDTGGQGDCSWTPGNAIAGLGGPSFYKDQLGFVHLSGIALASDAGGGDATCDTVAQNEDGIVFTLPAGYRPERAEIHGLGNIQMVIVGSVPLELGGGFVLEPGVVYASGTTPPIAALDGITFRAADAATAAADVAETAAGPESRALRRLLGLD